MEKEIEHDDVELLAADHKGPRILLRLEPAGKTLSLPRPKTVWQLLAALNLEEETAIVARNGKLLTPDRRIWPNDNLWVRVVVSRG